MRAPALLALLALCVALAQATPARRKDVAAGSGQDRMDDALTAIRRLRLPVRLRPGGDNASSSHTSGGGPRASGATSHSLWLRYTHPRTLNLAGQQHADEEVVTGSLVQPLDHEDPDNTATWTQVYYRNSASYRPGGAAFVMISGTEDYNPSRDWLKEGQMADLARTFNADRYFLPTRYFDQANHPTSDVSTGSLRTLTVELILQDVIAFLDHLLVRGDLVKGQKVILFGAGFGGAIATWARMRFPENVSGVVASGPTLEAKYDTFSYFPVVTTAVDWYHKYDLKCEPYLRQAYTDLDAALGTADGRREFNARFQPCTPFPEDKAVSEDDRAQVLGLVASVFADAVQEDVDGPNDDERPGGDVLYPLCYVLSQQSAGTSPLATLGMIVGAVLPGVCLETSAQKLVADLADPSWASDASRQGLRQWLWLQCTQLSQMPTSTSNVYTFPYSKRLSMSFYMKVCAGAFGNSVSTEALAESLRDIQANYGGRKPDISNAIFVRGDLDPWRDLGPSDSLTGEEVHVFSVKRASHAHDMFPRDDFDPPWMKKTRKAIASVLARWLGKA